MQPDPSPATLRTSPLPNTRDGGVFAPPDQPPPAPSQPMASLDQPPPSATRAHGLFSMERLPAFPRRRSSSANTTNSATSKAVVTDAAAPPALPDYALGAGARPALLREKDAPSDAGLKSLKSAGSPERLTRSSGRTPTPAAAAASAATWNGQRAAMLGPIPSHTTALHMHESTMLHLQIAELTNKRISTLDYLRKAHESRVYWFNTYLFDLSDLSRMPYFEARKLARKATNFLLLGLSLPLIGDLYSSSALEFLRALNGLLSEFDSFQQLHGDSPASLTRARLPNMFRRPKPRRSTTSSSETPTFDDAHFASASGGPVSSPTPSFMNFAASESDLLPGEEYSYLLTPSLPFEPDFFETFATLCDALIECYRRFKALAPTQRECSGAVGEMFYKADGRIRKLIIQGVVKEFEEYSRSNMKSEVAGVSRVVLNGLM